MNPQLAAERLDRATYSLPPRQHRPIDPTGLRGHRDQLAADRDQLRLVLAARASRRRGAQGLRSVKRIGAATARLTKRVRHLDVLIRRAEAGSRHVW